MPLTRNQRELLRLTAASDEPVAMSDFFHTVEPPPATPMTEDHPEHEAWSQRQIDLYGDMLHLHQQQYVRIVHPANGERPDLVEVTDAGRAALA